MILTEETQVPASALPVDHFKDHLRLSTGFTTDSVQDSLLESFLRAALTAIEAQTGKALLERGFIWELSAWRDRAGQIIPIAPIKQVDMVRLIDRLSIETQVDVTSLRLVKDMQCPMLRPMGSLLPAIPSGGVIRISFTAGFGLTWADLPTDLTQAVLLLASHFYEFRHETSLSNGCMPFGVTALIERYRTIRLSMGGS